MGVWTARQIWNSLDRGQREDVALAYWEDTRLGSVERRMAIDPWLKARGLRPAYLEKRSRTQRAALMAQGGLPEESAMQLLMSYHLVRRSDLLGRFLDELGIAHENGLIAEESEPDPPDAGKLEQAVKALREEFEPESVDLYMKTLTASDELTWAGLAPLIPDP